MIYGLCHDTKPRQEREPLQIPIFKESQTMTINYSIRAEISGDADAISNVHHDAFKGDESIASLVPRLRQLDAPFETISLVAQSPSGAVLGHVMLSHSWLDASDRLIDILVLSPLGVVSVAQKNGIGTALIDRAIEELSLIHI